MQCVDFRDPIRDELRGNSAGLTWAQLQERLRLPYDRPCPAFFAVIMDSRAPRNRPMQRIGWKRTLKFTRLLRAGQ
jgi:hypothetical protein